MAQQICFGFVYLAEGLIAWQLFEALLPRKRKLGICVSMYALCYLAAFLMYQTAGQLLNVVAFLLGNVVILFVCYRCSLGTALFLQCHRIGNDDGDRVAGCFSILSNYRAIWQFFPICSPVGGDGCYQQAAIFLVCPNLSYAQ